MYVAPGASATTTMQVYSPNYASAGFYIVGMNAANASNTNYSAAVSANLAVYSNLDVSVASNQTTYSSNQTANLTANITVNNSSMADAGVTFTIYRPNGTVAAVGTAVSNSSGAATFNYRFNRKKDAPGTYQVSVNADLNGVSGSGSTSFTLAK